MLERMLSLLVSESYRAQIDHVGIRGGITMTVRPPGLGNTALVDVRQDHPITGLPVFFVHPCNTATALTEVLEPNKMVTPADYMSLWLGIVGGSVGLSLPVDVARD